MTTLPNTSGTRYLYTKPKLWLLVDGKEYPVTTVTSTWAQNSVPTCEVAIPIGINVKTLVELIPPSGSSNLPSIGENTDATRLQRAKVIQRLTGDAVPSGQWPDEDIVHFDGFIAGRGHTEADAQVFLTIQLVHWLSQLDGSSALSGTTHPGGVTDGTFRAVFGSPEGLTRPAFISDNYPDAAIQDPLNITADIWGKGLQPLFVQMTAENSVFLSAANDLCGEQLKNGNAEAAEALGRMTGSSQYAVPLKLADVNEAGTVAAKILGWLQGRINETIVSSTLWEKIIGDLAPGLMFAVVPRVQDALVVPQQFACRDVWKTLYYDDTFPPMQMHRGARRPLRGVLAFAQSSYNTGLIAEDAVAPGGCFLPEAAGKGLLTHVVVPSWMSGLSLSISAPSQTAFRKQGAGSATSLPVTVDSAEADKRADARAQEADFYRRYAEWVYYTEALRNTHCRIESPLRFDICPGSTITLAPRPGSKQVRQTLEPNVGYVVSLTHQIDANSLTASTTFELSHLRTVAENEAGRFSSNTHAIYGKLFVGAPLIDELQFE